jgi:hypothetical protein
MQRVELRQLAERNEAIDHAANGGPRMLREHTPEPVHQRIV